MLLPFMASELSFEPHTPQEAQGPGNVRRNSALPSRWYPAECDEIDTNDENQYSVSSRSLLLLLLLLLFGRFLWRLLDHGRVPAT